MQHSKEIIQNSKEIIQHSKEISLHITHITQEPRLFFQNQNQLGYALRVICVMCNNRYA